MITKQLSFFLVDDDPDDTFLFGDIVSDVSPSINFASAVDGEEALKKLREATTLPDIIFLDLNMPRMDGKECLRQLKADESLKRIPVIIFTTSSQSKDIEEVMMGGAVCFITKPSNVRELKNILSAIAESTPANLKPTLQMLSNKSTAFIVC